MLRVRAGIQQRLHCIRRPEQIAKLLRRVSVVRVLPAMLPPLDAA